MSRLAGAPRRPMVIAHRGASGHRPEHTAEAYRLAFRMGADAVEPDLVPSADGVLVVRHESDISTTTDVAVRPEFAGRRSTKIVDGRPVTGWFTEDFLWAELRELHARERRPEVRPANVRWNDTLPLLSLPELFDLADEMAVELGRPLGIVAELKRAADFTREGIPVAELLERDAVAAGWNDEEHSELFWVESADLPVLTGLAERGAPGRLVLLLDPEEKRASPVTPGSVLAAIADLPSAIDGVSVNKELLLDPSVGAELVSAVHGGDRDLFCWTLRPENRYLGSSWRTGDGEAAWGRWAEEWRTIFALGVDAVFADHPDLALHVRSGHRG